MILESFEAGQRRTEHLVLDSLTVNTPLKNLILVVRQIEPNPRIDVYVDCHYEGAIPLKRTFRQIADDNNDERVKAVGSFFFPLQLSLKNKYLCEKKVCKFKFVVERSSKPLLFTSRSV